MKNEIVPIEPQDFPEFGESLNDHWITEAVIECLLRGEVIRVPGNGCGVVYLKFKENSRA